MGFIDYFIEKNTVDEHSIQDRFVLDECLRPRQSRRQSGPTCYEERVKEGKMGENKANRGKIRSLLLLTNSEVENDKCTVF